MILYNCIYGTLQNSSNLHVLHRCCFAEFFCELMCYASNAIYWHLFMSVDANVMCDELAESINQHIVDGRVGAVLCNERNQRGEECVGGREAIDTLDDVGQN